MKHRVILCSIFMLCLVSCKPSNRTESDAKIYGLVLLEISQKYGGTGSNSIYLKEELSEPTESLGATSKKLIVSEALKVRISALAKNENLILHWVSSTQKLEFESESGKIIGGGILVGFTKVNYSSSILAEIEASIFLSSEEAFGKKYSVKLENHQWSLRNVESTWVTWLFSAWHTIT